MRMSSGRFVTLEGGDGSGKSVQCFHLKRRLESVGIDVVHTREPGGTPDGERLRGMLLGGEAGRWSSSAEAMLFYAARDQHVEKIIFPALSRGAWVLCDRFSDSSRAYQRAAGGASETLLDALDSVIDSRVRPDLTFILDLSPDVSLYRASSPDRFAVKGREYLEGIRRGFLEIAEANSERCRLVDVSERNIEEVSTEIWRLLTERFPEAAGDVGG